MKTEFHITSAKSDEPNRNGTISSGEEKNDQNYGKL